MSDVSSLRAALVLFEGLPPTVIDSQVLTHVRLAREMLGIDMAIVAVACARDIFEQSATRLERARQVAGGEVRLIRGVRPALPGSLAVNRLLLGRALDALGLISFVHARADYAAAVAGPWGLRHKVPVLWDCRGDSRAEMNERLGETSPVMAAYRAHLLRRELRIAGQSCAGACFVTRQLRDLMAEFMAGQPTWVIPCIAPESDFFFDPALRDKMRNELAISADEAVYVYSGSLVAYQRFDETVETFQRALASGQKARLIVLTPDVERARQACAALPAGSTICRSVDHTQVNGYLNAADFGMLLRDSTPVNHVAFPTKFAEYAMTGLQVVMKDSPPSCVEAARALDNYVALGDKTAPWPQSARARCAAQAAQKLGRLSVMPTYAKIYAGPGRA